MAGRSSRARRALLVLMTALFTVGAVELLSAVVLAVIDGRVPTWSRLQRERAAVAAGGERRPGSGDEIASASAAVAEVSRWMLRLNEREVVHPYLGYVEHRPGDATDSGRQDRNPEAASYGFPRNSSGIFHEPSPDRLVVVVVGGSFSRQIGFGGQLLLKEGLATIDRFRGREVTVIALGLGGYKQPQQLMTIGYFLALGMHIDVLINIDGFNEVVLPVTENLELGVNPFFPRAWSFRVADLDPDELRLRGEIEYSRQLRARRAAVFSRVPWRYGMSCSLLWRLLDRRALGIEARAEAELRATGAEDSGYQATGPEFEVVSDQRTAERLVDVWRRCSVLLDELARANDIEYYHFLQPNQYVPGSKPLSGRERRAAVDPAAGLAEPVARGYQLMRAAAPDLATAGVTFEDLTEVFADVAETLYVDDCCHVNERGIGLVVDRVVAAVALGPRVGAPSVAGGFDREQP